MKKAMNILAVFLAVILSILLCVSLLALALGRAAESALQRQGLADILEEVDYGQVLDNLDYDSLLSSVGELAIPGTDYVLDRATVLRAVDTLDKEALARLYIRDVLSSLRQESGRQRFTADAVEEVLTRSQDELLEIARGLVDEETVRQQLISAVSEQFSYLGTEEQRQQAVEAYLQQHSDEVQWAVDAARAAITVAMPTAIRTAAEMAVKELPAPDDVTKQLLDAIEESELPKTLQTATFAALLLAAAAALLIFLLRLRRWKGLGWLGADFLLSAALIYCAAAILVRGEFIAYLLSHLATDYPVEPVIVPAAAFLSAQLRQFALPLAAAGAGALLLFLLLHALTGARRRREQAL